MKQPMKVSLFGHWEVLIETIWRMNTSNIYLLSPLYRMTINRQLKLDLHVTSRDGHKSHLAVKDNQTMCLS